MKEEMQKLQDWLDKNHIDYKRTKEYVEGIGRNQILIETNEIKLSFICHYGSYGYEAGLIEMWDFENDPVGWLTAEECKKIIKKHLKNKEQL